MKSTEQNKQYPNLVTITYKDGKKLSCKVEVKHPMISFSEHPHMWLDNAEKKMIELYQGKDENTAREFETLLKNNTENRKANDISPELMFYLVNLIKKNEQKIEEIVKLFINGHKKIDNAEFKELIFYYIVNKDKFRKNICPSKKIRIEEKFELTDKDKANITNFINEINDKTNHNSTEIRSIEVNTKKYELDVDDKNIEEANIKLISQLCQMITHSNADFELIINDATAKLEDITGQISWKFTE